MKPVTILDLERGVSMEKLARMIDQRGYQSSRAIAEKPKREKASIVPTELDARQFWYRSEGRPINDVIKKLTNKPMTIDEIITLIGTQKPWAIKRSLEYARRYGFIEMRGHGTWVSTGKHLTLKP